MEITLGLSIVLNVAAAVAFAILWCFYKTADDMRKHWRDECKKSDSQRVQHQRELANAQLTIEKVTEALNQ